MSKREEIKKANDLKRLVKYRSIANRRNCCKYWGKTTHPHFIVMCEVCFKLAQNGYDFWTEVEGKDGLWRADILAINGSVGQIIEILHTETDKKFENKKDSYPKEFILRSVRTKGFNIDEFDI